MANIAVEQIKRNLTDLKDKLKQTEAQHKREVEFYEEQKKSLTDEIASWEAVLAVVDQPASTAKKATVKK